ncbi:MAG: hypothetical protein KAR03_05605, partial [Candidatus Thorarchaeota archaeon]|nr:hypothetical protein [Candidatus Thorarchaeota archaeon]
GLNIMWALPIGLWIGAENTIIAGSVREEMKGRALGTYRYATSMIGFFAFSFGAYIWEISNSLSFLFGFAGIATLVFAFLMIPAVKSIDLPSAQETQNAALEANIDDKTEETNTS